MTETFGDEDAPKPKGGLPRWFWWTCGIGCAAAIVVVAVMVVAGVMVAKSASNPEVVIPKVRKYLQSDEWPEGYSATGTEIFGAGTYLIEWPGGQVMLQPMPSRAQLEELMDPSSASTWIQTDEVEGELEIQGRTVSTLTFGQRGAGDMRTLRADLSGDVGPFYAVNVISPSGDPDPESLRRFLEPFDVWRGED